jgi:hypothetical protein
MQARADPCVDVCVFTVRESCMPERCGNDIVPPCRNLCAIHARRVTIMVKDMQLSRRIRGLQRA